MGTISTQNGAYGIYTVLTKNLLIEGCEVVCVSDAGIYIEQSKNLVARNNRALYNVADIESENSTGLEIYENDVFENTSGLLIFNLLKLTLYGKNVTTHNNIQDFRVKGSIIIDVPKGTGVIIMATQNVDFYNNIVEDYVTNGLSVVSYLVFAAEEKAEAIINQSIQDRGIRAVESD